MSDFTKWSNMCEGLLAFTCRRISKHGTHNVPNSICWTFKIDFIISILVALPLLYQVKLYYQYYGGQIFNSRQRILYLCILTSILGGLAFSVVNMIAFSQISFVVTQTLYWQVLGYFILKVKQLSRGRQITTLYTMYWVFVCVFIIYTLIFIVSPIEDDRFCPGLIEKEHWVIKSILLIGVIVLYVFASLILRKLLSNESDTLLDREVQVNRNVQFHKLKVIMIIIIISEFSRIVGTIFTLIFTSSKGGCYLIDGERNEALSVFLILLYRISAFYLTIVGLMWMLWLKKSNLSVRFTETYAEEDFNRSSRFASKLAYQGNISTNRLTLDSKFQDQIDEDSDDDEKVNKKG